MAFTIDNPEAGRPAAVRRPAKRTPSMERIAEIQAFVASLPDRDSRSLEQMLYDEYGLPR